MDLGLHRSDDMKGRDMAERVDHGQSWDYVIVGGGSAGCVLANRLSADPKIRVLLLEAGGWDKGLPFRIPAGVSKLGNRYDWGYQAMPDPSRNDKVETWNSGKVLGGGSSVNMMVWVRGDRSDFDGWRDQGCEGWGYDDVLPYFKKAETFVDGPSPYRGGSGPIGVTEVTTPLEVTDDFLDAAQEAGHARNPDYNAEQQLGVARVQMNQRRGLRSNTARAYLAPVRKRSNLTVITGALVSRVRVDQGRAQGVEYVHEGQPLYAAARREVILSAGALASPKLLMLSGIGPAAHLKEQGIEVKLDLPSVGTNLQDHPYAMLMYSTTAGTLGEELKPFKALKHGINFLFRRRGALTVSGCTAILFSQLSGEAATEIEMILIPIGMSFESKGGDESAERSMENIKFLPHHMMIYPSIVHPRGRGSLRLASSDPSVKPVINHELVGGRDLDGLIAACRQARQIFQTSVMKAKGTHEVIPGDRVQSDEEWEAYLRAGAFRVYHPVGTCRMGSDDDAVVDPELRVRGIQGLRVVDASIFPTITSGNTNAPTIMVAERAADLILSTPTA
jgi:choline dehydrogenase-like flavoprotein